MNVTILILMMNGPIGLVYARAQLRGFPNGYRLGCFLITSQYGWRRMLNTGGYRNQPITEAAPTARIELINRVRSSARCSTSVMVPVGLLFLRDRNRAT